MTDCEKRSREMISVSLLNRQLSNLLRAGACLKKKKTKTKPTTVFSYLSRSFRGTPPTALWSKPRASSGKTPRKLFAFRMEGSGNSSCTWCRVFVHQLAGYAIPPGKRNHSLALGFLTGRRTSKPLHALKARGRRNFLWQTSALRDM